MIDGNNKPIQEEGIGIVDKRNEWYLVAATKVNPTIANKKECSSLKKMEMFEFNISLSKF